MDTLVNIRTFLAAARLGSFVAASRQLAVAPSVVSKRIGQLEHELKVVLFHRSTREMLLTSDGTRLLPQCEKILSQFDELRELEGRDTIGGHLRVDAPGTVTSRIFGPLFSEFLLKYPGIDMELRLVDRLSGYVDLDCDLTVGTRPTTSGQVIDFPLMPYSNATYASADYVRANGEPQHPYDLIDHSCLTSLLYGNTWHFYGEAGDFAITNKPRLQVNDAIVLREAVRQDLGIAVLPTILVEDDLNSGRIVRLLPHFRPPPMWLKAMVPNQKMLNPNVRALLSFLHERLANMPGAQSENPEVKFGSAARPVPELATAETGKVEVSALD